MESLTINFSRNLYTADSVVQPDEMIHLFLPLIMEEMNTGLCKEFTSEEISNALFHIGPIKAPDPDGFLIRVFQKNWDTMREDMTRVVPNFFVTGVMPCGVNDTSIVLLPKKEEPKNLKDFRPISLCNIIYKVVSKCLVNRLRPLLQDLIDPVSECICAGKDNNR
jgi:hypothetical protein